MRLIPASLSGLVFILVFSVQGYADETALPKDDLQRLREVANQSLSEKSFDPAKESFLKIIEIDPKNIEAHRQIGLIDLHLDNAEEAIQYLEKAIQHGGQDVITYYLLGTDYVRYGDLDKALEAYETSTVKNPSFPSSWHDLGILYYRKDNPEKAAESFKRALALKPDSYKTMLALGLAYVKLGKPEEAVGLVTALREVKEETSAVHLENMLRTYQESRTVIEPTEANFTPDISKASQERSSSSQGKGKISITGNAQINLKSAGSAESSQGPAVPQSKADDKKVLSA